MARGTVRSRVQGCRSDAESSSADSNQVLLSVDNMGVNWRNCYGKVGTEAMVSARHRSEAAPRTGAQPRVDSKAEAIGELMLEVAQCFFRIRAVGQKTGLITSWGGGAFGFMRSLALLGPLTVPQIAEMRPTSRQRMQRLADELAAEGLVEFVENPKHRRSKLVRLTRKGDARFQKWTARFLAIASTMGGDLSEADIRKTVQIVRRISDEAKGRSEPRRLRRTTTAAAVKSGV
jgi:DNA-binding MarR family transcriptional regulator